MQSTSDTQGRPSGTIMTGTVGSVDIHARSFVFVEDTGRAHQFVWTGSAQLWHHGCNSSPSALKPGMRILLNLLTPLSEEGDVALIVRLPPFSQAETGSPKQTSP